MMYNSLWYMVLLYKIQCIKQCIVSGYIIENSRHCVCVCVLCQLYMKVCTRYPNIENMYCKHWRDESILSVIFVRCGGVSALRGWLYDVQYMAC